MDFTFYCTYYPPLTNDIPITIDYSLKTQKKIDGLKEHREGILIHSGNWWSMKNPELRTEEAIESSVSDIYNKLKAFAGSKTGLSAKLMGFMSCNEQPYLENGKNGVPYWMEDPKKMIPFIEKSLDNANASLDNFNSGKIKVPVYCTLPVINEKQAEKYFSSAFESGHRHFSIGVSEFLKSPKYKFEGIARVFKIVKTIRNVTGDKTKIHVSGASSFNLIPYLAFLGANSSDGSTPVQSALAYGTIFNYLGKGTSASQLLELYKGYKDLNLKTKKYSDRSEIGIDVDSEKMNIMHILEPESAEEFEAASKKLKYSGAIGWLLDEGYSESKSICKCEICAGKNNKERILAFNRGTNHYSAAEARVIHNIYVWRQLILSIKMEMSKDPMGWLQSFLNRKKGTYLKKIHKIALELE